MNTPVSQSARPTAIDTNAPLLDDLTRSVRGAVFAPGTADYDTARTVWNAMIDKRPAAIVQCTCEHDVVAGLAFARKANLPVSVKGGGHNIAGSALTDAGLVLDMSKLRSVQVDPDTRRATVQAGALLSDVDEAAAPHGLAVPLGINSTTGVAGLTLGGGYGWLTRKYGLTIDSLLSARVVTSDGQCLTANANENSDLFWALRGGAGNFGVVTEFEYRLHPVGNDVFAGLIVHSADDAVSKLAALRDLSRDFPDDLTVWAVLRKAPPLPFLPESAHGEPVVVFAFCWCGDPSEDTSALEAVRAIGAPLGEMMARQPYADWQKAFDPLTDAGARNYWKSHYFADLDDGLIDTLVEAVTRLPTEECEIFIAQLGGAPEKLDIAETAFAHRDSPFMMNVHARWRDPKDDMRCIAWAREYFERAEAYATGGAYSNFMAEDETDRAEAAYGRFYLRLVSLKSKYDPGNVLRSNINIPPTS